MSEVSLGTVYDINKNLMEKENRLSNSVVRKKIQEIAQEYFKKGYYMLLCHEKRDYTVFNILSDINAGCAAQELKECLQNRGEILAIDKVADSSNIYEIWLKTPEGAFAFYLFPYNDGIIIC